MNILQRIIVILGCCAVLAGALLPPRKVSGRNEPVRQRAFLFSPRIYKAHYKSWSDGALDDGTPIERFSYTACEIDLPRMLAEWVAVLAATAVLVAACPSRRRQQRER